MIKPHATLSGIIQLSRTANARANNEYIPYDITQIHVDLKVTYGCVAPPPFYYGGRGYLVNIEKAKLCRIF